MNNNLKLLFICALLVNFMFSVVLTITGLVSGTYLDDYKNYISLKYPNKYMKVDSLKFAGARMNISSHDYFGKLEVIGVLEKTGQKIKITVGKEKYFNYNIEKYPVYSSRLTEDYFLKKAPVEYYNAEFSSFIMIIYFKLSFFPLLGLAIYVSMRLIKDYRNATII